MAAKMPVEQLALVPFSFPTYANALGRAAIVAAIELDHTGMWAVDHLGDGRGSRRCLTRRSRTRIRPCPYRQEEDLGNPFNWNVPAGRPGWLHERVQPVLPGQPGHEDDLREAVQALQNSPGYRPGDYDLPIATIHEARFVLFDDDTRLLFATSFDGPWDAYMEDFASKPLQLFDAIFRHVEGYEGLPDLAAVKDFILSAQATAGGIRAELPRHGQGDPQGAASEQGVPAGARRSRGRGGAAAPGAEAAARRGRRRLSGPPRDHEQRCRTTSPGRGRMAEPIADITDLYAFPSPEHPGHLVLVLNTLPFAQPSARVLRRADLPLPVAAAHPSDRDGWGAVRRRAARRSCSTACSPPRERTRREGSEQEGTCTHADGRDGLVQGGRRAGRLRPRRSRVRRPAVGSVHHGCAGGAEDDRHGKARVHRPGRDLPGRQERPQPGCRGRLRQAARRR